MPPCAAVRSARSALPRMRLAILAFTVGIALLQVQAALPPLAWLAGLAVLGAGALFAVWRRRHLAWRLVALFACLLLGFAWAGYRAQLRLAQQLPLAWEGQVIELTGVVASLPQRFERGERFVLDVESVHTAQAIVPGRILLAWYHAWDKVPEAASGADEEDGADDAAPAPAALPRGVHPGERWRFVVRLKRPHGNANPYSFDYEAWLLERGIRATGSVRVKAAPQRLDAFVARPAYVVERMRDAIRQRFLDALPEAPYVGVLTALAVGDQRAIPAAQWQVFNRTGVTHLMSISGLHVTMVAALLAFCVNFLWRRSERLMLRLPAQKAAILAAWLGALAYALLAGFEVPAQRTLYMLSVVAAALWSGRHLGVSRTLLLALLAVLLLDPWAVLSIGFWLSFGAVAVLFYVGVARVAGAAGSDFGLFRWGMTQWAVTLGSLPLLLLFFQQFSLVSPLANALAIPVVSFAVTPLALLFAVLPWTPLLQFDHELLRLLLLALEWLAHWPVWQQAAPPGWAVLLALLGVAWLLLPRGFPARWLGLCLLLPALFPPLARPPAGEVRVDVLDVGQGLAVLVRTAGHALLYDTGPRYGGDADAGARVVVPYLRALGVRALDVLVVSHRDKDHAGGMASVQGALPVRRLLSSMPELQGDLCADGQSWAWDGVGFSILHPEAGAYREAKKKANSLSCVLRVDAGGQRLLLTGDIGVAEEKALLARASERLRSDVLVVPHHGGKNSSSAEFVAAVGAREAIFSVGYRNAFGHPRPEVLERHAASRQWRTDRDGALQVALGKVPHVLSWRREQPRYWHGQ